MPTPQKEQIVQEMTDKFAKATGVYLVDFTGLDVNSATDLRRKLREAKVEYRVVKNTLAKRSLHNAGIEGLDEYLTGVNAYAISYDDPTVPVKVLDKQKEVKEKLKLKAAIFEGKILGAEEVEKIAKLPSREELLSQLMGMLKSPMTKLAGTLNAVPSKLAQVLKALEETKK